MTEADKIRLEQIGNNLKFTSHCLDARGEPKRQTVEDLFFCYDLIKDLQGVLKDRLEETGQDEAFTKGYLKGLREGVGLGVEEAAVLVRKEGEQETRRDYPAMAEELQSIATRLQEGMVGGIVTSSGTYWSGENCPIGEPLGDHFSQGRRESGSWIQNSRRLQSIRESLAESPRTWLNVPQEDTRFLLSLLDEALERLGRYER